MLSQRYLAFAAILEGKFDEAVSHMGDSTIEDPEISTSNQAFDVIGIVEGWVLLTANGVALPDHHMMTSAVANSVAFFVKRRFLSQIPYARRIQAMLDWHSGQYSAAAAALQHGLSIARRIGELPEQARCLFWRAKVAHASGHVERAVRDLDEATKLFAYLQAWPEYSKARALKHTSFDRGIVL
jgi:tetratricopeptide (TPR) repeat protein